MVKIHDGSLVPASELLGGAAEDDDGNKIKFEQVKEANTPTYKAEAPMNDGTGRSRVYQFSFEDTNVTVHQSILDPEGEKAEAAAKKEKEKEAAAATEAEHKKLTTEKSFKETLVPSSSHPEPTKKSSSSVITNKK